MISTQDRQRIVALITEARQAGARLRPACRVAGIDARTWYRWHASDGNLRTDRRPEARRTPPTHKLSTQERQIIVETCSQKRFASLPPSQIVPALADEGRYIASESSFYRVLRAGDLQHRRGRARAPRHSPKPRSFVATAPCQVWSWDITWLPGPIRGHFYYLYMIIDIFSRLIVGWEIHEQENSQNASMLLRKAILAQGCQNDPPVLHSDNGSPMTGSTMLATMQSLGVHPSTSRPGVSNDNPYSEAIFRTCKYRPAYPANGFASIDEARKWIQGFTHWYNHEHRHSKIGFVTPAQRHSAADQAILSKREQLYADARRRNPRRWSGKSRNWSRKEEVSLNPDKCRENNRRP